MATSAHHARKAAEELFDGHHADLQDAFVKFVEDARLKAERFGKQRREWGRARGADQTLRESAAMQHGLADNQFAHKIHYGINATGIDAQGAFCHRRNRFEAACPDLAASDIIGVLGGFTQRQLVPLARPEDRFPEARGRAFVRLLRARRTERQETIAWNAAALLEERPAGCTLARAASTTSTVAAARLSSGRRAISVPQLCSTFRNQFEMPLRAHQAVRIDAKRHVVNGFAPVNRLQRS